MNHEVVAELVEETTTRVGLTVNAKLDKRQHPAYMKGMAIETASVKLRIVCIRMGEDLYHLAEPAVNTGRSTA